MRFAVCSLRAGFIVAALTVLAACSGNEWMSAGTGAPSGGVASPSTLPEQRVAQHGPHVATRLFANARRPFGVQSETTIFVAVEASSGDSVVVYDATSKQQIGQLTGFGSVHGLTTDKAGNLYVVDSTKAQIDVYAPPYSAPPTLVISEPGQIPWNVAVSRTNVLAVLHYDRGDVTFYPAATTTPCATVHDYSTFKVAQYGAFDDHARLFISGTDAAGTAHVGEIGGGCRARQILELSTSNQLSTPAGIAIDTSNNVAVGDGTNLDVYASPSGTTLGTPSYTTLLAAPGGDPGNFALDTNGYALYVLPRRCLSDCAAAATRSRVDEDYYPSGTAAASLAVTGLPAGIAVSPPVNPKPAPSTSTDVFASYDDSGSGAVNAYDVASTNPVAQLTAVANPGHVATDANGNLYVVDTANGSVDEFSPPYGDTPSKIIPPDGSNAPVFGLAVSSTGILAVTHSPGSGKGVDFYSPGTTTPCKSLATPFDASWAAFDASGNLYVTIYEVASYEALAKISGGCNATGYTLFSTRSTNGYLGSIAVDTAGDLAILDSAGRQVVYTYAPPTGTALGPVIQTVSLTAGICAQDFTLDASGSDLYAYADCNDDASASIDEFSYPGGSSVASFATNGGQSVHIASAVVKDP